MNSAKLIDLVVVDFLRSVPVPEKQALVPNYSAGQPLLREVII
jgi:hypothetical protein